MWGTLVSWQQWLVFFSTLLIAVCVALVVHYLLIRIMSSVARRTASGIEELLIQHLRQPLRWLMIVLAVYLATVPFQLPGTFDDFARQVLSIVSILLVIWLLIGATYALSDIIFLRFQIDVKDNLRARGIHTQVSVLRRVVIAAIVTIGLASILMTFPRIRQLGAAILASAGIAGIIIGLAAQRTLGNLIAGLQIAFTQPLRLDDVVIVEGEWGRIEEITLTYVVVKVWDLRRLIVPITYFIERPFQNWTRASTNILGTVLLYVDYTVPVDAVRAELQRILESTKLWDREVGLLQVTNASERTVELRVLVSAPDSGTSWDLRCLVREQLIAFIQEHYPHALPRLRAELPPSEGRTPSMMKE